VEETPMTIALLLLQNAVIAAASFLIMWRIAVALKDVTFVDAYWALGMVIIAAATFLATPAVNARKLVLLGLCLLWGARLGGYLIWRWQSQGPDRRYLTMMSKAQTDRGWGFAKASLLLVFVTQAPLQFIVCLPIQLGQIDAEPAAFGPLAWIGVALAIAGIAFETVGDWQLARFRADPENRGKVMQTGLWRYTRHPNYFGDACTWWGLYLIGAETATGIWALPGPVLLTFLLTKWSGVPTVERRLRKNRPGYEDYVQRTSGFIPWPPKAAPAKAPA
jgi:steroid 5-alpha reductase family enzyme